MPAWLSNDAALEKVQRGRSHKYLVMYGNVRELKLGMAYMHTAYARWFFIDSEHVAVPDVWYWWDSED